MSGKSLARVLYVDNQAEWRDEVGELLKTFGYDVLAVATSEEAIDCLEYPDQIDLVIADMRFVEEDVEDRSGLDLAFEIRDKHPNMPIIMLTAHAGTIPTELAQHMSRFPYRVSTVEKRNIKAGDTYGLFYQIESLLPWQKRPIYCFVIMPFQDEQDSVYDTIKGVLTKLQIQVLRADDEYQAGHIPSHIRHHLQHNSFVIADLSGNNPDVMYELGYAHALRKPTIILSRNHDDQPEFLRPFRAIEYGVGPTQIQALSGTLTKAIKDTLQRPVLMPRPSAAPLTHQTYVALLPPPPMGDDVSRKVIEPVVNKLKLREQTALNLKSKALAVEEIWDRIQRAEIIMADVSGGNAYVCYHLGASHALKGSCVLLLSHEGIQPPFNLQGFANKINYDPSKRSGTLQAQRRLEERIRACLKAGRSQVQGEWTGRGKTALQRRKDELLYIVKKDYERAINGLDEVSGRMASSLLVDEDLQEVKRLIGRWAEAFHVQIEHATTTAHVLEIAEDLNRQSTNWRDYAIKIVTSGDLPVASSLTVGNLGFEETQILARNSPIRRFHLQLQMAELQARYDTETRRIGALDKDIGQALDIVRIQILEEQRAERVSTREEIVLFIEKIETFLEIDVTGPKSKSSPT